MSRRTTRARGVQEKVEVFRRWEFSTPSVRERHSVPTPMGDNRTTNTGTVDVSRDRNGSYGRYTVIRDTADPTITVYYGHLSERDATVGQHVTAGQAIGRSGSTSNSDGPHLHLRDPHRRQPREPDARSSPRTESPRDLQDDHLGSRRCCRRTRRHPCRRSAAPAPPTTETATRPVGSAPAKPGHSTGPASPTRGDRAARRPSDLLTSEVDDHGDASPGESPYSQTDQARQPWHPIDIEPA